MEIDEIKKCPACGAPVDPVLTGDGKKHTVICPYCHNKIEIRPSSLHAVPIKGESNTGALKLTGKLHSFLNTGKGRAISLGIGLIMFSVLTARVLFSCFADKPYLPTVRQADRQQRTETGDPSAGKKYSSLIMVLRCPEDGQTYGAYYDYGYWSGTSWCGKTVSPGYWVWVGPDWYIWKNITAENASAGPSVNGKYFDLIQKITCPGDRTTYGAYYDYGYWAGTSWCGKTVSPGYWVWVEPDWYIWKSRSRE